jgi:hypothetical protein
MPRFASEHSSKTIIDLENRVRNVRHNMLSNWIPPTTLEAMHVNMVWDGLFHGPNLAKPQKLAK